MISKYLFNNQEFLCFGNDMHFPEEMEVKLIEENVNLENNKDIPIYGYADLMTLFLNPRSRTTDKILADNHVITWNDIKNAHVLNQIRKSPFSKRVRDLVKEKYANILDNVLFDK